MPGISVDPRPWNILAGLCLASSCSGRAIGTDGSGADGNEAETTQGTSTTLETGGPECSTDADCPYGYVCRDGVCEYDSAPDGHWGYDCYEDDDCDMLELCIYSYCEDVPQKASSCPPPDPAPSLEIPVAALGLSFADVDADGASELVIAMQSELQVYESGSDMPLVSPRGLESDTIDAMVGGQFDAMAGEDVVILFADELYLHGSDGVGNLAAPSVSPSPWPDSVGLLAGEFDDANAADLLIWASSGAGVLLGSGEMLELSTEDIVLATARSVDDPLGGFVLVRGSILDFYTADGAAITSSPMRGGSPHALTSIAHLGDGFDLSASHKQYDEGEWTLFEQWGPGTGNLGTAWGTSTPIQAIRGGDFDGDGHGDLALVGVGSRELHFSVLTDESCIGSYVFNGNVLGLVVGDHDGDGDDEIAIRSDVPHVAILDGE